MQHESHVHLCPGQLHGIKWITCALEPAWSSLSKITWRSFARPDVSDAWHDKLEGCIKWRKECNSNHSLISSDAKIGQLEG
eukprot:1570249-Amphidinium_carterae.1